MHRNHEDRTNGSSLDFGVGISWLRGHPQDPKSNSGGWLPATSGFMAQVSLALPSPEPLRVTGPLPSLVLRTEDLHALCALVLCIRGNGIIHRAHKAIQGDECRPRRSSWLRFPWLDPIRNSFKLRGFYSRSYFGPRTCGGGITNVIEVAGLSIRVSPCHP